MKPKFTQKHLKAIAELLSSLTVVQVKTIPTQGKFSHASYGAIVLVDSLCDLFAKSNPKFNKKQFISACGFKPWDKVIMGIPFYKEVLNDFSR